MVQLKQHPLAIELMPGGMSAEEFDSFCADVESRGIIYPISLYEGMVLDGWHRYRAAQRTGTAFKTIEYTGSDPAGYIAACNIHRRKLSSLQRALFAAKVHLRNGIPQAKICKQYSISNTVLSMVLKAIDSRNAAILKRIESDGDYTRGMLREELEERGLVHANYGRSAAPAPVAPVSVFNLPQQQAEEPPAPTDTVDTVTLEPVVGKRPSHPERRPQATAAQKLQQSWRELMADEKTTFLKMVWPEAAVLALEAGLALPKGKEAQAIKRTPKPARVKAGTTK